MRKSILMFMLVLGLTFIYNPRTNSGYVYINQDPSHWIIIVDENRGIMQYYLATPNVHEDLGYGLEAWIRDKVDKGMPFKSMIIPFRYQQQDQKRLR